MTMYVLCHCMLEVCNLPFDFIGGYNEEIALSLRRDWDIAESVKDYKYFEVKINAFALWYGYGMMQGRKQSIMI